jgi:hypothetical protein
VKKSSPDSAPDQDEHVIWHRITEHPDSLPGSDALVPAVYTPTLPFPASRLVFGRNGIDRWYVLIPNSSPPRYLFSHTVDTTKDTRPIEAHGLPPTPGDARGSTLATD